MKFKISSNTDTQVKYMAYVFNEGIMGVKELAREINQTCDAYKRREITSEDMKGYIRRYAQLYPGMLFNGDDYNPTVKKIVGERRFILINLALEDFQISFS